jgi:hypothetical protein
MASFSNFKSTGISEVLEKEPEAVHIIVNSGAPSFVQYAYDGDLEVQSGTTKLFSPDSFSCTSIIGRLGTAADADIDLVINKNDSQTDTLTILSGNTVATDSASFTLVPGDYITVDISTVGTSAKGKDLNISFKLER